MDGLDRLIWEWSAEWIRQMTEEGKEKSVERGDEKKTTKYI